MRKRLYIGIGVILLIALGGIVFWSALQGNRTEHFILRHMVNENGTLATYRLAGYKGRERVKRRAVKLYQNLQGYGYNIRLIKMIKLYLMNK